MLKKISYRSSIINRLTLLMFFLSIVVLTALFLSAQIANDTKGSASLINQLGLLRMKNYQLLSSLPLNENDDKQLTIFKNIADSQNYTHLFERYHLQDEFNQLQTDWLNNIRPNLKKAQTIDEIKDDIEQYVARIDHLVKAIDQQTENQISYILQIQFVFILIIVLFMIFQIYYLRRHILVPWKKLINMAQSIAKHDFSERFIVRRDKNEFDTLGIALNNMSEQLESQYLLLEDRVNEKTAELQGKNEIVSFLYQSTKQLHTAKPICERFLVILHQLEALTPLRQFQIRFYENDDLERYEEIGYDKHQKSPGCENPTCSACLLSSKRPAQGENHYWYLQDDNGKYGLLFAILPEQMQLSEDQKNLVAGLVEQMTMAIALERQIERQKQYLLMKERSAMARELHDSIAQSLSCLKIHTSCLQMQTDLSTKESQELLSTMRKEINIAYSQLRELITSFRLNLNQTGFYASLQDLVKEFEGKLGFAINLNYQLPSNIINSKYAIHLLQIIREALTNIYKHAKATHVDIDLMLIEHKMITISIQDNGIGLQNHRKKENHYGLIIMQDRAELLNSQLSIESEPNKGTKITLTFTNNRNIPIVSL